MHISTPKRPQMLANLLGGDFCVHLRTEMHLSVPNCTCRPQRGHQRENLGSSGRPGSTRVARGVRDPLNYPARHEHGSSGIKARVARGVRDPLNYLARREHGSSGIKARVARGVRDPLNYLARRAHGSSGGDPAAAGRCMPAVARHSSKLFQGVPPT
jgi:hypothetical protein